MSERKALGPSSKRVKGSPLPQTLPAVRLFPYMHPSPIFDFSSGSPDQPLVLVPTAFERSALQAAGCDWPIELCGFGVIAAAARAGGLLQAQRPSRVLLLGIAGTYDAQALPVASARRFASLGLWGLGAGSGEQHLGPADMLPQWTLEQEGQPDQPIEQDLTTHSGSGRLITVCAASASPAEADPIRARYPDALAEDMEAFAVALACRLHAVPFDCIRGISNVVGERDKSRWVLRPALEAAWKLAQTEFTSAL
ncbi:MAG: futalosine hydrolase [Planctomycetota bacterium]|jgi:futalosine hydrolase